jgi:hypothetical protein
VLVLVRLDLAVILATLVEIVTRKAQGQVPQQYGSICSR